MPWLDSFSGHAPPIGARSVLKARSEPQYILRGVQVTICHITQWEQRCTRSASVLGTFGNAPQRLHACVVLWGETAITVTPASSALYDRICRNEPHATSSVDFASRLRAMPRMFKSS